LSYEQAINAAQKQVAPGYIVTGSDWSYDGAGKLSIRFKVINIANNPGIAIGPPQTVMVQSVTPAIAELAKINLSSFIMSTLDDVDDMVIRACALAQQQISTIYTVSVLDEYYCQFQTTFRSILYIKFAITNNINPNDAARDDYLRNIDVFPSFSLPTAEEKMEEIVIPSVLVNMPVYWALTQDEAVKKTLEQAQKQVGTYYTVTLIATNYDEVGELGCILNLATNFLPYSEWAIRKTIKVYSTLSAAYELSKINVSVIETDISPISAGAQDFAVNRAIYDAQKQISPEYTVTLVGSMYSPSYPSGTFWGLFQVEKNGEPSDMARDGNFRIINVRQSGLLT
jgi:hypothetical protein